MNTDEQTKIAANKSLVTSYSDRGSKAYEDPMNKDFLYGEITVRFIAGIPIRDNDQTILDIGCGTGFVFDELHEVFEVGSIQGIGVEPAQGMLELATRKHQDNANFQFHLGSFEDLPVADKSVDHIVSTLALHWVKSLAVAADEMRRVLKTDGAVDILMIAKDDGANFKKAIVEALKKYLSFRQIMTTAILVQRARPDQVVAAFEDGFEVRVEEFRDIVYGTFDEHIKWWTARSTPVIAEVEDKEQFMDDLRKE